MESEGYLIPILKVRVLHHQSEYFWTGSKDAQKAQKWKGERVASRKCSLVTRVEVDWTKGGFTKVSCGWSRGE